MTSKLLLITFLTTLTIKHKFGYFNLLRKQRFSFYKTLLFKYTSTLDDKYPLSYRVYWFIHNYCNFPMCTTCGKRLIDPKYFLNISDGFRTHCSNKCAQLDINVKNTIQQTTLKHYGNGVYFKSDDYKEQMKKFLGSYSNVFQLPEIKNKIKTTLKTKYGVEHPMQYKEFLEKSRGKYLFNGVKFDSSYELALYIYLSDNNIDFTYQPNVSFEYTVDEKIHRYFPDFRVQTTYIEIKGIQFFKNHDVNNEMIDFYGNRTNDKIYAAKLKCMKENHVQILTNVDIKKYLDYIKAKYGSYKYLQLFRISKNNLVETV